MTRHGIEISQEKLAEFCRRHHIRELSLFGSFVRDDFTPESDIDVLVQFEPGHVPGLALIRIEDELSRLLGGHKVDLVIKDALNKRIRKYVLEEAQLQYVA